MRIAPATRSLTLVVGALLPAAIAAAQTALQPAVLALGADSLRYALGVPRESPAPGERRPLVVYLHGGAGGEDVGAVVGDASALAIVEHVGDSAYVAAPLNRFARGFWDLGAVARLLDSLTAKHPIDTTRIYLTGASRGGLGAWMLAMQYPRRFAALVPVCGAVPHPYHVWIEDDLPIWVFHGAEDEAIPTTETLLLLERLRLRKREPQARVTIYEGVGHAAWERAYREEEMYAWLLRQRLR